MNKEYYYTTKEAAERIPNKTGGIGISYKYLQNHKKEICKRLKIKPIKRSNILYFLKSEIDSLCQR